MGKTIKGESVDEAKVTAVRTWFDKRKADYKTKKASQAPAPGTAAPKRKWEAADGGGGPTKPGGGDKPLRGKPLVTVRRNRSIVS